MKFIIFFILFNFTTFAQDIDLGEFGVKMPFKKIDLHFKRDQAGLIEVFNKLADEESDKFENLLGEEISPKNEQNIENDLLKDFLYE